MSLKNNKFRKKKCEISKGLKVNLSIVQKDFFCIINDNYFYDKPQKYSFYEKELMWSTKRGILPGEAYEKSNGDTFYYRDPGVKFFYESKSIKQEFVT